VGGGVLCAIGEKNRYLLSTMAEIADDVILTKGAAVETTAVLTRAFPHTVRKALGPDLFASALRYLTEVTTVKDALTVASVGIHESGVTAMHDVTEGGIIAASLEIAQASRVGIELSLDEVHVSEETKAICRLFRIDPLTSLGEGSLIISCRPHKTDAVLRALSAKGIHARVVGRIRSKAFGKRGTVHNRSFQLKYPKADPYWRAYWTATRKGWD
jgi:hydrogenase maturation factor